MSTQSRWILRTHVRCTLHLDRTKGWLHLYSTLETAALLGAESRNLAERGSYAWLPPEARRAIATSISWRAAAPTSGLAATGRRMMLRREFMLLRQALCLRAACRAFMA